MKQSVIIIPALNPSEKLLTYVETLIEKHFNKILIVNDGSDEKYKYIFDELERKQQVTVFNHAINMGKGRALKNAFNYVVTKWCADEICGVITVDSDGQHKVEDVIRLQGEMLQKQEESIILGTRDFNRGGVPFKSRWGNKITSQVFRLLYGVNLKDTQTGLRAIPLSILKSYLDLPGERFEYEMNMLIYDAIHNQRIKTIDIETIYFDNNSESHFQPFADSLKIYKLIFKGFFKYILSSLSSAIIDISIYRLMLYLFAMIGNIQSIVAASVIARIISSFYNFFINRNMVFKSKGKPMKQLARYYLLCGIQMLCSIGLIILLDLVFGWNKVIEKIIVDSFLFIVSYQIQRVWVYKG